MPITHLAPAVSAAKSGKPGKSTPVRNLDSENTTEPTPFTRIGHPDDACLTVTHLNEYLEDTLGIPLTGEDQVALPANLGSQPCECAIEIAATVVENMPELEVALVTYARFLEELEALTEELEMDAPHPSQTSDDIHFLLSELQYALTHCRYRITIE